MSPVVFQVVVSEYHSKERGLSEKRVIPGLGHEVCKIDGFRCTSDKTEQVPSSTSLLSFARGYRTERTACQQSRVRCDGSGVKEIVIQWCCGVLARCPCEDWGTHSSSCLECWLLTAGDCFQYRGTALPEFMPLFKDPPCLNWDNCKGPSQIPRKSYWGSQLHSHCSLVFPASQSCFPHFLRALPIKRPVHKSLVS